MTPFTEVDKLAKSRKNIDTCVHLLTEELHHLKLAMAAHQANAGRDSQIIVLEYALSSAETSLALLRDVRTHIDIILL